MKKQQLKGLDDLPEFESEPYMKEIGHKQWKMQQVPICEIARIILKPSDYRDGVYKKHLLVGIVGRDINSTKIYYNSSPIENENGELVGDTVDYNYITVDAIDSYEIIPSFTTQEPSLERRI